MPRTVQNEIESLLKWWVRGVARNAWGALIAVLALAVASLYAAMAHLSVNTDSSDMIAADKPFRVNDRILNQEFPQLKNQILVIVRGRTPDEADYAAELLAERLRDRPERFRDIFAPSVQDFFQRQGLLFLDLDDLVDVTGRIASSAPLLEDLIADPGLPKFFEQLSFAAKAGEEGISLSNVASAYDEVARVVESTIESDPAPLSWQRLFGGGEELVQRIMVIQPELDFTSLQPAAPALEALREAVAALPVELQQGATVFITGDAALRTQELRSVSRGIEVSAVISLVLVSVLLALGLRAWQFVLASVAALLTSIMITAGFAALSIGELNLVSIAFTVLLIGLGIDFAIHLVLQYREQRHHGAGHEAALEGAVGEVGVALALAALTTAVAFFAFVPTDFVGMAQLGVISGTGVFIAFAVALTMIPALLTVLPRVRPKAGAKPGMGRVGAVLERAAVPATLVAFLVGALAATQLDEVRFDADPMNLRDPDSPAVRAFNLLFDRKSDQPYRLDLLAGDLDKALTLEDRAEGLDTVHAAVTLSDFVPKNQDAKLAEIDFLAGDLAFVLSGDAQARQADGDVDRERAKAAIDDLIAASTQIASREEGNERGAAAARLEAALTDFRRRAEGDAALYGLLEANLLRFFPMQIERLRLQMTARPVSIENLPPDIRRRYVSQSGRVRVEVLPAQDIREPEARRRFVETVAQLHPIVGGGAQSVLRAGEVVSAAMIQATSTAAALGALIIFITTRRLGFVVLILAPLALAGVLTAATGVLIDRPFNFANVIVLPLLIGLGVDSGIHLAMRARRTDAASVFQTSTPRAVVFSALTTIGSFGSLALSDHRGTASMGELLVIAIAFTLLATLVVLPGLMKLQGRIGAGRTARTAADKSGG